MSGNKLQPHFVLLCERLNLDKLLPFLRQERMVTNDEYEILTNVAYTRTQQRQRLLTILPRKGRHYFENFGKCLVWSGQVELARHIGVEVDSVPPAPYATSAGGQADTTEKNKALLDAIQNLISEHANDPEPPQYPPPPPLHPEVPPTSLPPGAGQHATPQGGQPPTTHSQAGPGVGGASMAHGMRHVPEASRVSVSVPVTTSPAHIDQRPPDSTKVFILYCKDTTLLQPYRISEDQFIQDVLELADILVYCGGFQSCSIDLYEIDEQPNWNIWTQKKIEESTYVVMVCSPQFIRHLSQKERSDVRMYKGMFFSDTVVNSIVAPKFVPVFLNHCIPVHPKHWMPPQLHAARYFWLRYLRELMQDVQAQDYSDMEQERERERNQVLFQKLRDPKHKELARLVGYLRKEQEVVPPIAPLIPVQLPSKSPHNSPIPERHAMARSSFNESVAADYIPEATFVEIAGRLRQEWVHLGVKLGVPYSSIDLLRRKHTPDLVPAVLEMFGIWQHLKGREATKKALKRALVDLNFGRLAVECFNDIKI